MPGVIQQGKSQCENCVGDETYIWEWDCWILFAKSLQRTSFFPHSTQSLLPQLWTARLFSTCVTPPPPSWTGTSWTPSWAETMAPHTWALHTPEDHPPPTCRCAVQNTRELVWLIVILARLDSGRVNFITRWANILVRFVNKLAR
jgi:hypothetical protein